MGKGFVHGTQGKPAAPPLTRGRFSVRSIRSLSILTEKSNNGNCISMVSQNFAEFCGREQKKLFSPLAEEGFLHYHESGRFFDIFNIEKEDDCT